MDIHALGQDVSPPVLRSPPPEHRPYTRPNGCGHAESGDRSVTRRESADIERATGVRPATAEYVSVSRLSELT
nr:hypothetical protein JVH1_4179 [Rhodococcus sp. JVH1]